MNGKKVGLGVKDRNDEAGAWAAKSRLESMANSPNIMPGPVKELVPLFLESCRARGLNPKTIKSNTYELNWLVALNPFGAIADIRPESVAAEAAAKPWSDSHRANVLATVQRFMRWAGREKFKLDLPAKESRGGESIITDDMWRLIQRQTKGDFHQLLRVLWLTGARPGEIAGLTAESMDWQTGTAKLKRHKMRRKGKQRVLFFGPEAMAVLREQFASHGDGYLFRSRGEKPFSAHAIAVRFIRLRRDHGINVTAYCFRHTWATRALSRGEPDAHVAALMGHSSTRMIHAHYSHVNQNAALLKEVAARVE